MAAVTRLGPGGYPIAAAVSAPPPGPANYIDFAGNIGGAGSLYGKGLYGKALYSRDPAFTPTFAGDFDIVGQQFFDGNLAPVVTFSGSIGLLTDLSQGNLAPQVTFAANLGLLTNFSGDLAPQIDLEGLLGLDQLLTGDLPCSVIFAASELLSGPLWGVSTPCPPAGWTDAEPCPPPLWTPVDPCDAVDWEDSELCNG